MGIRNSRPQLDDYFSTSEEHKPFETGFDFESISCRSSILASFSLYPEFEAGVQPRLRWVAGPHRDLASTMHEPTNPYRFIPLQEVFSPQTFQFSFSFQLSQRCPSPSRELVLIVHGPNLFSVSSHCNLAWGTTVLKSRTSADVTTGRAPGNHAFSFLSQLTLVSIYI